MQLNFTKNSSLEHNYLSLLLEGLEYLRNSHPDRLRSAIYFPPPIVCHPVKGKIGWLVVPENSSEFDLALLYRLHYLFIHHEFTTTEKEEFFLHFIDEKFFPDKKIIWIHDLMILVLLFDVLINKYKVIPATNNLYDILCEHFEWIDKRSNKIKPLKRDSLKSILNKAKRNPDVENIVSNFTYLLLGR